MASFMGATGASEADRQAERDEAAALVRRTLFLTLNDPFDGKLSQRTIRTADSQERDEMSAAVTTDQPGAAALLARNGDPLPLTVATAYANSIDFAKEAHHGCFLVKCMACGGCPVCITWNTDLCCCCEDVLCFLPLCCLPCVVPPLCGIASLFCAGEREGNVYVRYDSLHATKWCGLMIVDKERSTIACYRGVCCTKDLQPASSAICVKLC